MINVFIKVPIALKVTETSTFELYGKYISRSESILTVRKLQFKFCRTSDLAELIWVGSEVTFVGLCVAQ
jgi:hypothetical protein